MTTKQVGNIGEINIIAAFVDRCIPVYIPFGDNEKADLIAEFNGKLQKIQIKTTENTESYDGDFAYFDLTSSTTHRSNGVKHVYSKDEIDYFALYNIETRECFLIAVNDAPRLCITLRYTAPKNNQVKGIRFAKDFTFDKIIEI